MFGISKYIYAGVGVIMLGLVATIGVYKYRLVVAENSLLEVKFQREQLKEEILVQQKLAAKRKIAEALSDQRLEDQLKQANEIQEILETIYAHPDEDARPVSPVIESTIDRLWRRDNADQ